MSAPSERRRSRSSWIIRRRLNCEKPLWMFVGRDVQFHAGSVSAVWTGPVPGFKHFVRKATQETWKKALFGLSFRSLRVAAPGFFTFIQESGTSKNQVDVGREGSQGEGVQKDFRSG